VARAASGGAGAIGLAALAGWTFQIPALKSVLPGLVAMQPWTAIAVLLCASALWLAGSKSSAGRAASAVPAIALAGVIGLPLIEYATGYTFGTDLLLFPHAVLIGQTQLYQNPGRTAQAPVLMLFALAWALLLAPRVRSATGRTIFSLMATVPLAVTVVVLFGYILGLELLDDIFRRNPVALHTTFAVGALSVGVLGLRPDAGWVRMAIQQGAPGATAFGFLAAAALLLVFGSDAAARVGLTGHNAASAALQLEALLSTLKDAETGQRGYLLTNKPSYLEPYEAARLRLSGELGATEAVLPVSGGRGRRALLDLSKHVDQKMMELSETILLQRTGNATEALAVVETDRGKATMDLIRSEVDTLEQELNDIARVNSDRAGWAAALAALGTVGLTGLAFSAFAMAERGRRAAAEARALLHIVIETTPGLIYAKDRQGRLVLSNAAVAAMVNKPGTELEGRTDREYLADPVEAEMIMLNDRQVMEAGVTQEFEELAGRAGGHPRVWLSTKTPMRDAAGQVVGIVGVSIEITERKLAEDRLRLMVDELNHRVKNTLVTVQSIAGQTLRGSDPAVYQALEGRLHALAAVHDVLTHESWKDAGMYEVIGRAVAPFSLAGDGRFDISGPPMRLQPHAAVALSMGLHELATNAIKHGALLAEAGRVAIRWEITRCAEPHLVMTWTETHGPPVVAPKTRGFGMRMIERGLAQDLCGTVQVTFNPEGITCRLEAPLVEFVAASRTIPFPRVREMKAS
jgi:PAS domain S-box-containing protein